MEETKKIENETVETEVKEEAVNETVENDVEEVVTESKLKSMFTKAWNFADKHKGEIVTGIVTIAAIVIGKKMLSKDSGVQEVIFVDEAKEIVDAVLSEVDTEDVVDALKSEVVTE